MLDIIDRAWRQLVASTLTDEELCNELVKVAMRNGASRRANQTHGYGVHGRGWRQHGSEPRSLWRNWSSDGRRRDIRFATMTMNTPDQHIPMN